MHDVISEPLVQTNVEPVVSQVLQWRFCVDFLRVARRLEEFVDSINSTVILFSFERRARISKERRLVIFSRFRTEERIVWKCLARRWKREENCRDVIVGWIDYRLRSRRVFYSTITYQSFHRDDWDRVEIHPRGDFSFPVEDDHTTGFTGKSSWGAGGAMDGNECGAGGTLQRQTDDYSLQRDGVPMYLKSSS